jgi:hypothetical protein
MFGRYCDAEKEKVVAGRLFMLLTGEIGRIMCWGLKETICVVGLDGLWMY